MHAYMNNIIMSICQSMLRHGVAGDSPALAILSFPVSRHGTLSPTPSLPEAESVGERALLLTKEVLAVEIVEAVLLSVVVAVAFTVMA